MHMYNLNVKHSDKLHETKLLHTENGTSQFTLEKNQNEFEDDWLLGCRTM
jgi:hypothetical protein